jgi:hypothetical protein
LPASVKEKFEEYAKADSARIGELPGWVFRRLIFTYNKAANAGLSITDVCELIDKKIQQIKQKTTRNRDENSA